MAGTNFIRGHSRRTLVSNTALSVTGSTGLGAFNVQPYSRLTGLFSVVGSLTFQYRLGINSGSWLVSSTFVVNSGGSVFDVLNIGGNVADFGFTAANSQANIAVNLLGEPLR
jgi:hypothetical protein